MTVDQWLSLGLVLLWAIFGFIMLITNCVAYCKQFSVVRCIECREYDLETHCCKFWPDEGYRHPDHFCAEAKRREDNR